MKNVKLFSLVLAVVVTFLILNGVISGFSMMTDWFNGLSPQTQKILNASAPLIIGVIVAVGAFFRFRKKKNEIV
jgi:hypothetical protein